MKAGEWSTTRYKHRCPIKFTGGKDFVYIDIDYGHGPVDCINMYDYIKGASTQKTRKDFVKAVDEYMTELTVHDFDNWMIVR